MIPGLEVNGVVLTLGIEISLKDSWGRSTLLKFVIAGINPIYWSLGHRG